MYSYRLTLDPASQADAPRLDLSEVQLPPEELKTDGHLAGKVLASELSPAEINFVPEGLAIRTDGEKGLLCNVEVYRWVKRAEGGVDEGAKGEMEVDEGSAHETMEEVIEAI